MLSVYKYNICVWDTVPTYFYPPLDGVWNPIVGFTPYPMMDESMLCINNILYINNITLNIYIELKTSNNLYQKTKLGGSTTEFFIFFPKKNGLSSSPF